MNSWDENVFDLNGRSIMITGGTGSFGRSFVREILRRYKPRRVVIYSRDELKQYEMQTDPEFANRPELRFFIGDVRDLARLELAMDGIEIVVHAAALKQVPTAEYNPMECIRTNVMGAENVMLAAIRGNVEKVIALSTDKAASPVNLYGASKLASDKIMIAANNLAGRRNTRFAVVRYGNVVGSRGSVVPFYRRLIQDGAKSLPITDPRMTRFWITLPQGVGFVLHCLNRMKGGEIFIPKIPSMRIVDLARAMAPHLDTHVVGIRPGEKLHEAMITEDDSYYTLEFDDHYVIEPTFVDSDAARHPGGRPVPEGFRYASNLNGHWLSAEEMLRLI
ncbi:MAG TPA: UDP-N-acetylglucosamine 4,6-dehydratase (inverting) [Azospirillaceae bacterium]|nr:UDP-N-acetylglucosamine 4,6-dehydratase (inverting) [Azospirillaceae bacterium]